MNLRQSILHRVAAEPGISIHALHTAFGIKEERKRRVFYAQVSQLCKEGNLRKESLLRAEKTGSPKLWPTETTLVSRRGARRCGLSSASTTALRAVGQASVPAQTVDEFLARGGRIHHCAPDESATPLRFDHSNTEVPLGRRRPVVRARPAVAR